MKETIATLDPLAKAGFTTAPVSAGTTNHFLPEFLRWQDVQRIFGLKRGTLYNLLAAGHISSVSLRRQGRARGVRLFSYQSIRSYLVGLMEANK